MTDASSGDGSAFERIRAVLAGWLAGSGVVRGVDGATDRFGVATTESRVASAGATVGDWVRASWCYRWLTAEPEPDVIVIDLRETYTVGPIIRVLDGVIDRLAAAWDGSAADATVDAVVDAPVRALGVVVGVAVLIETAFALVLGDLGGSALLVRAVVFGLAALAIQVPLSATEVAETRTGRLVRAVLEPPEPSDGRVDDRNEDDEDRE